VLLDVFVGVLIMGLVVFQIQRELETLDSRELSQLTD
jgi:hydrogenase-4 membrane subunit HyfE